MKIKLLLLLTSFVLGACTTTVPPKPDDPAYAPVVTGAANYQPRTQGSLYQAGNSMMLFEDRRAHRVGDILTVMLSESTTANKLAATDISKESATEITEPTILGNTVNLSAVNSLATSIDATREFESESTSDQSNSLQGSIAVTIAEILPNGLMRVRGEKWMTLNSGEEFIRVRGLVRPEDINPDNTVMSMKLADARITYSGTGDFANSNKQGWLGRLFNSEYWPF